MSRRCIQERLMPVGQPLHTCGRCAAAPVRRTFAFSVRLRVLGVSVVD
jgi:hypothetical protein